MEWRFIALVCSVALVQKAACSTIVPFGVPVVPLVKIIYAVLFGVTIDSGAALEKCCSFPVKVPSTTNDISVISEALS